MKTAASIYFILGIIFLFLTPPFQTPDEPEHFARAISIARGDLFNKKTNRGTGDFFFDEGNKEFFSLARLQFHQEQKISLEQLSILLKESHSIRRFLFSENHSGDLNHFYAFNNTVLYSPVSYLPQILGIWICALFNLSFLASVYVVRLMVLMASASILGFTLHRLKNYQAPFLIVSILILLPMWIFQGMSAGMDSILLSLCCLLLSYIFYPNSGKNKNIMPTFLGGLVSLCKFTYAPLFLLYLPRIWREESEKNRWFKPLGALFLVLLPTVLWMWLTRGLYSPIQEDADPAAQIQFVWNNPQEYLSIIFRSLTQNFQFYRSSTIGVLGWADTPFRYAGEFFVVLCAGMLFLPTERDFLIKIEEVGFIFFVSVIVIFLIFSALYISYNLTATPTVVGVQGRYFLPLLPYIFLAIWRVSPGQKVPLRARQVVFTLLCLCLVFIEIKAIAALWKRYWI